MHEPDLLQHTFRSTDPSNGEVLWEGEMTDARGCATAVEAARSALPDWSRRPLEERIGILTKFAAELGLRRTALAKTIAQESGKPLWEADTEVSSMVAKVSASVKALHERAGTRTGEMPFGRSVLNHRALGVVAVLGPFNFPGHLPNGHIVPALLAGNTIVFKPSEYTPAVGIALQQALKAAGIPDGVFNMVQGDGRTGAALLSQDIDGVFFTGAAPTGAHLRRQFLDRPNVLLALELGGNNPLVAWDGDPEATASIVAASAFITTGQRCSCARRLIVPEGRAGDAVVEALLALSERLRIGAWNDQDEPFCGPLISERAASVAQERVRALLYLGGKVLRPFKNIQGRPGTFVSLGVLDFGNRVSSDLEIFAPVLQVFRASSFNKAIALANASRFGLSAGLISDDDSLWNEFQLRVRAGVVNRNRPVTGASGMMPFGGLGESGNQRPSAYYAADYCAYPVASFEADRVLDQSHDLRGLRNSR